jgi:hypothetical protein
MAITDRSLAELTGDLATHASELVRNEVRLARAELTDSAKQIGRGAAIVGAGAAVAAAALTLALFAIAYALSEAMPMWLSALIAAAIGAIVAWFAVKAGLKAMSADVGRHRVADARQPVRRRRQGASHRRRLLAA